MLTLMVMLPVLMAATLTTSFKPVVWVLLAVWLVPKYIMLFV